MIVIGEPIHTRFPLFVSRPRIIKQVIRHSLHLMQDAYGNYVVQYVVEKGEQSEAESVMKLLLGKIPRLSQQKYSSNVVEKCLQVDSARHIE